MVRDMLLGDQFWPRTMSNGDVIIGLRKRTLLNDFTTMWSAQVKIFATTPISELTLDDHSVIFLTVNTQAGAPALEYVRSAVYESYLSTEDSQQTVGLLVVLVLWIFVAMGPVLSVLLFCLLAPILVYIDHRRDDVMEAFLDVPDLVVMHLRKGAEKRLRALRSDDEDGEASDDDEDEEEAGRTAIVMGDGQPAVDMENEDGTVDWEAVVAIAARDEKLKGKPYGLAQAKGQASTSRKAIAAAAPPPASGCCSRLSCAPSGAADQRTLCSRGARAQGGFYRSLRKPDGTVVSFIRRDFKKSRLAVMKLGVFLLPVCVMFVFYLILYLVTTSTAAQVKALTSFASLSAIRESCIRTTRTNTYFMVSSPAYPPSLAFRYEWTSMQIATLNMANRLLTYDMLPDSDALDAGIVPSLTFRKAPGTELTSIAGIPEDTMESVRRAQGSDACEFLSRSRKVLPSFDIEECRSYNNKLLTSGLQAALQSFIVASRRLRDRRYHAAVPVTTRTGEGVLVETKTPEWAQYYNGRPIIGFADGVNFIAEGGTYVGTTPAGTAAGGRTDTAVPAVVKDGINGTLVVSITNYSVPQELAGEDMRVLFDMGTKYLLPGFEELSDTYMHAGVSLVLQYRVFIHAFVGGFLFLFAMGTWLLYFPAITRLGQDVQSKRAILLLLPPEVLSSIPSLKHMVLEIVAEHDGSATSTNTSMGQQVAKDEDSIEEQGAQGVAPKADLQANASGP